MFISSVLTSWMQSHARGRTCDSQKDQSLMEQGMRLTLLLSVKWPNRSARFNELACMAPLHWQRLAVTRVLS